MIKIFFVIVCVVVFSLPMFGQKIGSKPNIVFILADDLGWIDVGVNGSKYYETPNIDKLAASGMNFTNAYTASPLCSPTRASILTGRYPGRYHFTTPSGHLKPNAGEPLMKKQSAAWQKVVTPESRTFLPLEEVTIAELLKSNGYATGFIGKWHLGQNPYSPENQGFGYNVAGGPQPGPPSYFSPYKIKNLPDGPPHEYITDRITEEALTYMEAKKDSSFFLCMWEFAVHAPFQGKLEYVKQFTKKTDPRGKQNDPIMAAMIKSLDESVGRIMAKLDELKIAENTLVIFYSDNGGNMYDLVNGQTATNNYPLKDGKGNIHDGGVKVPLMMVWPGTIQPGSLSNEVVSSIDFFPTLLQVAGVARPKKLLLDGESILPVAVERKSLKRDAIFCYFPHYVPATDNYPATSVLYKNWKLIRVYGEGLKRSAGFELYNLKNDPGENVNLANANRQRVKKMNKLISQHIADIGGIEPILNPSFNPSAKSTMGVKNVFPTEKYPMY